MSKRAIVIRMTRDTSGGRWYTVYDTCGDEYENYATWAKAVESAHRCAAEQGVTFSLDAQVSK